MRTKILGVRPRAGPPRSVSTSRRRVPTTFQSCQSLAMDAASASLRLSSGECRFRCVSTTTILARLFLEPDAARATSTPPFHCDAGTQTTAPRWTALGDPAAVRLKEAPSHAAHQEQQQSSTYSVVACNVIGIVTLCNVLRRCGECDATSRFDRLLIDHMFDEPGRRRASGHSVGFVFHRGAGRRKL